MRLAPGDQQEREGHPDQTDERSGSERGAYCTQASPNGDERDEDRTREQQPQLDQRRRREVPNPDLDEHVRRAPDRRQQ